MNTKALDALNGRLDEMISGIAISAQAIQDLWNGTHQDDLAAIATLQQILGQDLQLVRLIPPLHLELRTMSAEISLQLHSFEQSGRESGATLLFTPLSAYRAARTIRNTYRSVRIRVDIEPTDMTTPITEKQND